MNTGQMLTVLFALAILSFVSLSINTLIIGQTTTLLETQASLNAISIAQSMIDEIMTKSYDAFTAGGTRIWNASDFSSSPLGPSSTENSNVPRPDITTPFRSVRYYNDADDYNGYSRIVNTPLMGQFTVRDTVYYVLESNPDQKQTSQTFFKKIVVTVTHPNMPYPLKISDVVVYRRYF